MKFQYDAFLNLTEVKEIIEKFNLKEWRDFSDPRLYINSTAKSRKRQLRSSLKRLNQHFPLLSFYYIIFRMPFVMYELLEIQQKREIDGACVSENGLQKHSAAMFMDRKVRDKIYTTLFQDGVMVAEKICKRNAGRMHNDVKDVPNLNVIKGESSTFSLNRSRILKYRLTQVSQGCFQLASLWLPEATSSSSSPGDTSTGSSPTKVLSTSESTSTSQLRSSHRPWRRHQRSSTTDHEVADESDSQPRLTLRTTETPTDGRRTPTLEPERPRVTALI